MNRAALTLSLLLLPPGAQAAPTAPDCTVIAGARAHLPDGPAEGITAVLADGLIRALGTDLAGLGAPGDGGVDWNGRRCVFVDGSGATLAPGFIDASSSLGLVEVGMEASTRHGDAGGPPVRAQVRIVDGYNPLSSLIPIARREGITTAILMPAGGSFPGIAGAVDLAGVTQGEALVADGVAVPAGLSQGTAFSSRLGHLRATLDAARLYLRNPSAWEGRAGLRDGAPDPAALAALKPVIDRAVPLVVGADAAWQLEALVRFAAAQDVRLVIDGAAEGWLVADALAEAGIAVLVDPYEHGPGAFTSLHARPDNPALLAQAGVQMMIASHSAHFARVLRQLAGNAVREGLPHEAALAAITSTPADVFGLNGRGRLRVGGVANVVLWTGDPLEIGSDPLGIWILGRARSLETRQTRLFDRYRTLPGSPTAPLPLP